MRTTILAAYGLAALAIAPSVALGQAPAAADVKFMTGMIAHHAQAVEMAALIPSRTTTKAMLLLGQRIDVSQRDEIKSMRSWLIDHHQPAPDPLNASHSAADMPGMDMSAGHPMLMPGMLTPAEMKTLAAAHGTEFDRLFLQGMIKHHEGALTMVADLFHAEGSAQDPLVFSFASDVDVDQRAEIARMKALLQTIK
jgi:uncharacterized protein (DUF305 family)